MGNTFRQILPPAALLLGAALLASACGTPITKCSFNSDCQGDLVCFQGECVDPRADLSTPDLAPPADLSLADLVGDLAGIPDLINAPDLYGLCPTNQKLCVKDCIPVDKCCTNADCPAAGQTCQVDHSCQCPMGQRVCGVACIPNATCCVNDDCLTKVCANGVCQNPSCSDGTKNGNESDLDCGGGFCGKCLVQRGCTINNDCRSNFCMSGSCTSPGFSPATSYGGGVSPVWTGSADLNNDTFADAVTVNSTSNTVSVMLGRGDGTFNSIGSFLVGLTPVSAVLADLNGDKRVDMVVVNQAGHDVSVLMGYGDGTFAPAVSYGTAGGPLWITTADVDGDKRLDLVVAAGLANQVSLLQGRGDGTFNPTINVNVGAIRPAGVAAGDFNGDGKIDIATGNTSSQNVSILLGKGGFTFNLPTFVPVAISPRLVITADHNADGKLDLIVGGGNIAVLIGAGNGGFQFVGTLGFGSQFITQGDLDGDGKLDIVHTSGVLRGNGNGSFLPNQAFTGVGGPLGIALADYDGDKKLDGVFIQSGNPNVIMEPGKGDGTFIATPPAPMMPGLINTDIGLLNPRWSSAADINGDGRDDFLAVSGNNRLLLVAFSNPNGTLQLPAAYVIPSGTPSGVASGDFDSDGKNDVVVSNAGLTTLSVYLNLGNGTMKAPTTLASSFATNGVFVGDVNGDMKADIVALSTGSNAIVFISNGDGTFKPALNLTTGTTPRNVVFADMNGDTFIDLVIANQNSASVSIIPGKGDGTFNAPVTVAFVNVRPNAVGVADLNGDMKPDLVVADGNSVNVVTALSTMMNMVPSFAPPTLAPAAASPIFLVVGDFDGDKKADVVTVNSGDRSASVLIGKGDGTYQPTVNSDVGVSPLAVSVGDFNGDKKPDISVPNSSSNTFSVLLNTF